MQRWIPVEAKGEFMHPAGVVQVMDDAAFRSILAQPIPAEGLQVDFDHYSDLTNAEREAVAKLGVQLPTTAAGWIKAFTRRIVGGIDKIFAQVDFTPEGAKAVEGKTYLYTSPVHPAKALEYLGDGKVRPHAISKVALTNEPNIRAIGPILANRAAASLANSAGKEAGDLTGEAMPIERLAPIRHDTTGENMESIAKALNCEPTEEAILAAIAALQKADVELKNRAAEEAKAEVAKAEEGRKAELEALKNRAEKAEGELAEVRAKIEADAITAKVQAELAKYPDLPNRADAEAYLRKDFDGAAKFLAGLPKIDKPAGTVPGQPPEDLKNRKLTLVELCERGTKK